MSQVALIIGGSGGIGSAIVNLLQKNGIKIYATYLSYTHDKLEEFENIKWMRCDITKDNDIKYVVDFIINKELKIDILINTTTSKLKLKLFDKLTYNEFFEDINVIILGSINLCKHIVPLMKENKSGIIINLLSETIKSIPQRMSSYIIAKYGLLGLTKSLAAELKRFNVDVYGISPSFVETDLIKAFPEKILEIQKNILSDKKFIQPEDIANLILNMIYNKGKYGLNTVVKTRQEIEELIEK